MLGDTPSTGDIAAKIVANAARDTDHSDFEESQRRHERRMRAMAALGDSGNSDFAFAICFGLIGAVICGGVLLATLYHYGVIH